MIPGLLEAGHIQLCDILTKNVIKCKINIEVEYGVFELVINRSQSYMIVLIRIAQLSIATKNVLAMASYS